jgi:hypothetical protein
MSMKAAILLQYALLLICTVQKVATGAVPSGYNVALVECEQPAAYQPSQLPENAV